MAKCCYRMNVCAPLHLNSKAQCDDTGIWLDHWGERGALTKGVSALIRETPVNAPIPSALCGHNKEEGFLWTGSESSPDTQSPGSFLRNF